MTAPLRVRSTYHHGDLARALLAIAIGHVRQMGVEGLSLREVAREAGVTVGAVYKHFADKEALLAAAAVAGFERLAVTTQKATRGRRGSARLLAVGQAYVAFASKETHLFRLMFSRLGMQQARSPLGLGLQGAFDQLRLAIADTQGIEPQAVAEDLLAVAWSIAHGAASLISDGVWKANDPRAHAALACAVALVESSAE
jgi:AcrR family transcriptional regulator